MKSNLPNTTAPRRAAFFRGIVPLLALGLLCSRALAVQPGQWVHATEADFEPGQNDHTVVSNLGEVKLSAGTRIVAELPDQASIIYDIQAMPAPGGAAGTGDLYIAAGPQGKLLRRQGDKVQTVLELAGEQIFSLDTTGNGRLLVAISGEKSRLALLDTAAGGDKLTTVVELPGVRYVWDMLVDGGRVFLATGSEGKLIMVDLSSGAGPKVTDLLDAAQANLLCIGRDGQGRIYVGSDTDGIVYRVTVKEGDPEVFVLYDAPEPEVGALLVTRDGTVYAGTADAEQARPGRLGEAAGVTGRVEAPAPGSAPGSAPGGGPPQQPPAPAPAPDKPPELPNVPPPAQPLSTPGAAGKAPAQPPAGQPADVDAAEPTPQQFDRMRQVIRERLDQARRSGAMQMATQAPARPRAMPRLAGAPPGPAGMPGAREGNAIYRIDPNGFVTEVFRESVMILRIVDDGAGKLLVATGSEGELYAVDPAAEETTLVADLEPQQVMALASAANATAITVGTSNPASLVEVERGFASQGTYSSTVLDASQISLWGKMHMTLTLPADTSVAVQTRSGNVEDPEQAQWSAWSAPAVFLPDSNALPLTPLEAPVKSPPARFLQYRLTFTGNTQATAVVDRVQITYVMPNMRPVINAITATYPGQDPMGQAGGAQPMPQTAMQRRPMGAIPGQPGAPAPEPEPVTILTIAWDAADPNNDQLRYTLEYRPAGADKWLPLAEDLDQPTFDWQTRRVPDGRYVIRVTASDALDNTADMANTATRLTDPVVVDNSPPAIEQLQHKINEGVLTITAEARDALSSIRSIHYGVDSSKEWKAVLPDDLIFDSTREPFTVKIAGLSAGQHVVTVKVMDAQSNTRYEAAIVQVK